MANIQRCDHTKDDGQPCNAIPVKNTPYCYFHRKFYNPPALPGDKNYEVPLLETHASIQIALTHLYQAFLARKIDMKEANFGLQILRLASKTISAIEKTNKQEIKEKKSEPSTGLPSVGSGFRAGPAERNLATSRITTPAEFEQPTEPKRGVWDPYGCMPNGNGSK